MCIAINLMSDLLWRALGGPALAVPFTELI